MEFQLPIAISKSKTPISYKDPIFLIGSCFTTHIGQYLEGLKFKILQNPNGILFDPSSVAGSLISYCRNTIYNESDLVRFDELWQSWQHHSQFSGIDREEVLHRINQSQLEAHTFLRSAKWLIITLGTSFSYRFSDQMPTENKRKAIFAGVANCHRAPGQWFEKQLMQIDEIYAVINQALKEARKLNPNIQIILTVSPVRHVRDGVVDNNRSKARLIESVHLLAEKIGGVSYFPAYELVVDVLRDYRFYDIDMVHPNYQATSFVLEKFSENFIDSSSQLLMKEVSQIMVAKKHKSFQPTTVAHRSFLQSYLEKTTELASKNPFLDLHNEIAYFSDLLQH